MVDLQRVYGRGRCWKPPSMLSPAVLGLCRGRHTETKVIIHSVSFHTITFRYLYGSCWANYCWNKPTTWADRLCNTSRVYHECRQVASMTMETLKGIRGDDQFDLFWTTMTSKAGATTWVNLHYLARRRKETMRFGDRLCERDFTKTANDLHRQEYTDANDTIVVCMHAEPARPTWTYNYSYIRIAANEGL